MPLRHCWTDANFVLIANDDGKTAEILTQDTDGVPQTKQQFLVSSNSQVVNAPTQAPVNFGPFVGTWYAHAQQLVIQADGKAVYTGRVFVWCVDDQGNTINQPPCDGGGNEGISPNQHALITFTSVQGNTASGSIMPGGTGMRNINDNIIPIGSTVTVTLHPDNDTHSVSNGSLLCGPQAIQNNVDPGCTSGA
jgi:hypothetical protein